MSTRIMLFPIMIAMSQCMACSSGSLAVLENIGDAVAKAGGCKSKIALCDEIKSLKLITDSNEACTEQATAVSKYVAQNNQKMEQAITDSSHYVSDWDNAKDAACSSYHSAKLAACISEFSEVYTKVSECEGLTEEQKESLTSLDAWYDLLVDIVDIAAKANSKKSKTKKNNNK